MSDVMRVVEGESSLLPVPARDQLAGGAITIRDAVLSDFDFIDALQKQHKLGVGFMYTAQIMGHLAQGHVIIAEDTLGREVGYCIGVDKYFKREDTGVIYQMNIVPGRQRGLIGATLLKAMFERSAYGVRLFCCWCAQDLPANRFWEAMGFTALAFRTGSKKKTFVNQQGEKVTQPRTHIFWQKRVRAGDDEIPWWFPSQTGNGAIGEDRIVLPIPAGTHWSDAKPAVLPGVNNVLLEIAGEREAEMKALQAASQSPEQVAARKAERKQARERAKQLRQAANERATSVASGGLRFAPAPGSAPGNGVDAGAKQKKDAAKAAKKKVAKKNDPRLVAMARELRDRWLEAVAEQPGLLEQGNGSAGHGKYDVCRQVEGGWAEKEAQPRVVEVVSVVDAVQVKRLDAA